MKKSSKYALSVSLLSVLCLNPFSVLAEEVPQSDWPAQSEENVASPSFIAPVEGTTGAVQNEVLTPEEEQYWAEAAAEKDAMLAAVPIPQESNTQSLAATVYTVGVPNFIQETAYWCGPAAVRQTLSFHKNKSQSGSTLPSQTTLASKAGTTTDGSTSTGLATALNAYKSSFGNYNYVASDIINGGTASAAFNTFKTRVTNEMVNGTYAPIVLLETQYLTRYAGKSIRHYNTVSGWNQTTGELRLVDPNYNTQYSGIRWDPMGSASANGVFRAVYNADLNGSNKAMVY